MPIERENVGCCAVCDDEVAGTTTEDTDIICDPCEESSETCSICELRYHQEEIYIVEGSIYCQECVWNYYITCDSCNDWCDVDSYHYDEDNDVRTCEDCRPVVRIRNYSWKPEPIFYHDVGSEKPYNSVKNDSRIVFGFELEVENHDEFNTREDLAEALHDYMGDFLYFKEDGSLDNGFEIISHPMTYAYFKANISEFKEMLSIIKDHGFRSYDSDTCGLHITLTRKCFTHSHFLKFVDFFNNSSNFKLLKALSQRTERSSGWATLRSDYNKRTLIDFAKCKDERQNVERQKALNLQNQKTMEVRLFRGTLKATSFFKAFESVLSIYDFTYKMTFTGLKINKPELDEHSKAVRDEILKNANLSGFIAPITKGLIRKNHFISYIASKKKQFPNLNNFVKEIDISNYKVHAQQSRINDLNKLINNERMYI